MRTEPPQMSSAPPPHALLRAALDKTLLSHLKHYGRAHNLPVVGTKSTLVDRILAHADASEDEGRTWRKDFDLIFERRR